MAKNINEMILINGELVCPKCLKREFKEIRNKHNYLSTIKDIRLSPKNKQHLGLFQFTYLCANCNIEITEYMNV